MLAQQLVSELRMTEKNSSERLFTEFISKSNLVYACTVFLERKERRA